MYSDLFTAESLAELKTAFLTQFPMALWETFYVTVLSTALAILLGLPLGVLLVAGEKDGVLPLPKPVLSALNVIINLLRSIPFLILMIMVFPLSRLIIGTAVGTTATIVPLVVAAFPFVARLVESSLREVDPNIIEAAQSMGATPMQIICKVMIPESVPSLIQNVTIALTTILGYSAMSGIIGGGGLGKIAIDYGYYRYKYLVMLVAVVLLILLVQLIASRGKSFRNAFCLCVTMIPTGIALLYQFSGIFTGTNAMGEETGIAIGFAKVWSNYSKSIPLSIVMGMALPIGVLSLNLLFDLKSIKQNRYYWFAWLNYIAATLMFLVFYEKGFRMMHANFSWGYMHGMFFVFLMTLIVMVKNIREWWKSWKVIFVIGEIAVFFYHLVCGVNFLMYAVMGNDLAGF